ncbi:MAG: alpha-hydroxy-acid oxidizing protein [Actinobacteria bacterium]|nr:alpha-hydroxy-acid oxidizing protein [Actinomycetota bacterium]
MLKTLRSVVSLRKFDWNGRRRRLAKCGNIDDVRRLAKRALPGGVFDYFDGAAETEWSLANNTSKFDDVRLEPRVLVDVSNIDTSTTVMGHRMAQPFAFSPTGFTRIATSQGELAVARVAARHGITYTLSTLGTRSIEEVAAVSGGPLWYQLYVWKDRGLSRELVQRAKAAGYQAIMVTVDTAVFGRRERDVRRGFTLPPKIGLETFIDGVRHPRWTLDFLTHEPITFSAVAGRGDVDGSTAITLSDYVNSQFDASLSWRDLDWVRSESGLPIMLKGIQTVADAKQARSEGVEAIALSNHGGRQYDGSPAPIELLPQVMDVVGDGIDVLVDGGVRRGADVVKACALGAKAAMFGRPYLYGLGAAGETGVDWVIDYFNAGVKRTMALVGARTLAELRGRATISSSGSKASARPS